MEGSHQNNLLLFSLLLQWKSVAFVFDLAWWFSKGKDYGYIFISSFKNFTQPLNLKAKKKSYFLKIAMSVSPIGLDLFPWLIFVCIHFPGVFSWISPVTLRTCIQCRWQKNRNQNQQETSEGWRCSCLKCVFKTPHKCFMHFISYIAEYFLKSEIYNCKNRWLYKNRRKLLFSGGIKDQGFRNH